MKRIVFSLLFFLLIAQQNLAQSSFGFKGGLNYTNNILIAKNLPADLYEGPEYRFAYHVGGFGKIALNKRFSLNPELQYSKKGFKSDIVDFRINEFIQKSHLNLHYLNLPVLIGFQPLNNLDLLFGPELGFLVSARTKYDSKSFNISDFYDNKFDFGLAGGINYSVVEKFVIGLRYTHGLSSVIKDIGISDHTGVIKDYNAKLQNRAFQFSFGYELR